MTTDAREMRYYPATDKGRVAAVTDPLGNSITMQYDNLIT